MKCFEMEERKDHGFGTLDSANGRKTQTELPSLVMELELSPPNSS